MHPAFAGRSFEALEREILARCGGASQAARLARDLHVLPDFLGNRSPFADPRARGARASASTSTRTRRACRRSMSPAFAGWRRGWRR